MRRSEHKTLLPAPSTTELGSQSVSSTVAGPSRNAGLPLRRPTVDVACNLCRKRKVKCNGAKPVCRNCRVQGAECVYNGAIRITPRQAVENQAELKMHEELYRILQTKDAATVESVLKHIRQGKDIRATLRHLQEGNLHVQMAVTPQTWTRYTFPYRQEMPSFLRQPGNLYLGSYLALGIEDALYQSGQRPSESLTDWKAAYRIPYHASRHVDHTIESANIAKWTQATDDSYLLRELLHAYFVYDYPLFAFFHKDLFLKDLVKGTGEHCSSLLVNTILALACHAYGKAPFRNEFWNPKSLQYRFSAEARRLQELKDGEPSITSVQAAAIMSVCCMMDGSDRLGWSYLLKSLALSEDIELFRHFGEMTDSMRTARVLTSWGLFMWQAQLCFHYLRAPLLRKPPPFILPDALGSQSSWYPEIWVQYPATDKPISLHFAESFQSQTRLQLLMNDVGLVAFPQAEKPRKLSIKQTYQFHSQLEQWFSNLPPSLSVRQATLPHQLIHHMQYHNVTMLLFRPIACDTVSGDSAASRSPATIVHNAKIHLETIWRLYYLRHGFEFWNSLLLHYQVVLGYSALDNLVSKVGVSAEDTDASRSTLALTLKGLNEQGRHSHLGLALYRLLRRQMQSKDSRVLQGLVEVAEEDEDVVAKRESHIDTQYPVNIASIAEDPEKYQMNNLASAHEDLVVQASPAKGAAD